MCSSLFGLQSSHVYGISLLAASWICLMVLIVKPMALIAQSEELLDRSEFEAMIYAASNFDTIDLSGKKVIISGSGIYLSKQLTIMGGNFQRACPYVTQLSDSFSSGSTELVVEDASGFSPGDWLIVASGPEFQQNSGGNNLKIADIAGDTIHMFNPFPFGMDSGALVFHQFPLFRLAVPANDHLEFNRTIFDGNRSCNDYIHDWRYNYTMNVRAGYSIIDCIFLNTPSENIFQCGGEVINCKSYNLNGSFVHGSCSQDATDTSMIVGNLSYNSCQQPIEVSGHNEGWFTYSANIHNFYILDNVAINGGNACFGNQGLDDYGNVITGNVFKNFPRRLNNLAAGHPQPDDFNNNIYYNVPQ